MILYLILKLITFIWVYYGIRYLMETCFSHVGRKPLIIMLWTAADGVSLISKGVSSVQDLPPCFIKAHTVHWPCESIR